MKIASWSAVHGISGVSSSLLAIAIYGTLRENTNCLITQINFKRNNLEYPVIGNMLKQYDMYQDIGIDTLTRCIKAAPLDEETIYNASVSLLNNKFNLLPGTMKYNQDCYESEMLKIANHILNAAEKYYDLVYIDTNSGSNKLSQLVIEKSDLIIVNLNQNKEVIDAYFSEYDFDSDKIFYLIGNYDNRSKNNLNNLRRRYKKMTSFNSAVIPYNTEFADALSGGCLIDFMKKNIAVKKPDKNTYFMENVSKATKKILKMAGWKGVVK